MVSGEDLSGLRFICHLGRGMHLTPEERFALRQLLVLLYDEGALRMICADIGLPAQSLALSGTLESQWAAVLQRAEAHGPRMLGDLLCRVAIPLPVDSALYLQVESLGLVDLRSDRARRWIGERSLPPSARFLPSLPREIRLLAFALIFGLVLIIALYGLGAALQLARWRMVGIYAQVVPPLTSSFGAGVGGALRLGLDLLLLPLASVPNIAATFWATALLGAVSWELLRRQMARLFLGLMSILVLPGVVGVALLLSAVHLEDLVMGPSGMSRGCAAEAQSVMLHPLSPVGHFEWLACDWLLSDDELARAARHDVGALYLWVCLLTLAMAARCWRAPTFKRGGLWLSRGLATLYLALSFRLLFSLGDAVAYAQHGLTFPRVLEILGPCGLETAAGPLPASDTAVWDLGANGDAPVLLVRSVVAGKASYRVVKLEPAPGCRVIRGEMENVWRP